MRLALCGFLVLIMAAMAQAQSVMLAWDSAPGATGYQVQRCVVPAGQATCTPTSLPGATTSFPTYTDTSLPSGTLMYTVIATASGQSSAPSNQVSVTVGAPPLTPPVALSVTVLIPQSRLTIQVDSQETGMAGVAVLALDSNPATFWHTHWQGGVAPGYPHWATLALDTEWWVSGLYYLPRQDMANSRIREYRIEGSRDNVTWTVLAQGTLTPNDTAAKVVRWPVVLLKYVTLYGVSSWNGLPFAGAAELSLIVGQSP